MKISVAAVVAFCSAAGRTVIPKGSSFHTGALKRRVLPASSTVPPIVPLDESFQNEVRIRTATSNVEYHVGRYSIDL